MTPAHGPASASTEDLKASETEIARTGAASIAVTLLVGLAIYFGLHVLTRTLLSNNLQLDEAEQLVLTQDWRLGYGSQPPLYNWMQKALFGMCGVNVFALSLLKNSVLWCAYLFTFLAAREVFQKAKLAALAAASLLFFPQIAWESQRDQSHLVLATALAAATLFIFIRLIKTRELKWYATFGAVVALGFLAKYNYLVLPAALVCAAALDSKTRPAILNGRMLLAVAAFAVLAGPHIQWMLQNQAAVASQSYKFSKSGSFSSMRHLTGPLQFLKAVLGISVAPFIIFGLVLSRDVRTLSFKTDNSFVKLVAKAIACGVVIILVATIVFGVTYIRDRWLQPLFFALPMVLIGFTVPLLRERQLKYLFGLATIIAATVLTAINVTAAFANTLHRAHNLNVPFPALANELRKAGFQNGTIIANGFYIAGNLKNQFRGARVMAPELDTQIPAARPTLIVWSARNEGGMDGFLAYASKIANFNPQQVHPAYVEVPCENGPRRSEKLGYILLR